MTNLAPFYAKILQAQIHYWWIERVELEAPPAAYLELACCIGWGLFEFAQFELAFVPVIVPVIHWKLAN